MGHRLPNIATTPIRRSVPDRGQPVGDPRQRYGDNGGVTAEHYFTASPTAAARPTEIEFQVGGREFRLRASGGVFSADRLDPGTGVLLRRAVRPGRASRGHLLDLGCGYGPIACVLATGAPKMTVHAVDVNERALELTRANVAELGLAGRVVVSGPDEVPADVVFAQIWSNPPIRVGKAELHAILDRWLPRLDPVGGEAWLVVAKNLGSDSLARWLVERGWAVVRHISEDGYRVLHITAGITAGNNSGDAGAPGPENV
jgi:16S rRNA (guanine1207-N2)-methyltransferase